MKNGAKLKTDHLLSLLKINVYNVRIVHFESFVKQTINVSNNTEL